MPASTAPRCRSCSRRATAACPASTRVRGPRRRARPVDRLARRAVQRRTGRGGADPAHVVRGARTVADRRAAARLAERGRRLQDPLRPGDAARPAEVRRGDPLRALRAGGPATPRRRSTTTAARLAWARHPDTEMECCSSVQASASFARGEGIWSRLGVATRRDQLDRMIELVDELYPTFRWFLFDGSRRYAAPVTVFGSQRAALYLGQLYLVLTSRRARAHAEPPLRLRSSATPSVQPTSIARTSPASAAGSTADPVESRTVRVVATASAPELGRPQHSAGVSVRRRVQGARASSSRVSRGRGGRDR